MPHCPTSEKYLDDDFLYQAFLTRYIRSSVFLTSFDGENVRFLFLSLLTFERTYNVSGYSC